MPVYILHILYDIVNTMTTYHYLSSMARNNGPPRGSLPRSNVQFADALAQFDNARDTMLDGRSPDATFEEFPKERVEEYINLVLCGIGPGGRYYTLDPPENCQDGYRGAQCFTDIDSALIFGDDHFPWEDTYDIFTTYALRKSHAGSLHILLNFVTNNEDGIQSQDPGSHANVLWGICGNRHRIYLMLPNMPEEQNLKTLLPLIYSATRSAAGDILPHTSSQWSPTYSAEVDRTHHFTTSTQDTESRKTIPAQGLGVAFANEALHTIQRYQWGKHAYWFVQMRGIKDKSRHLIFQTETVVDDILRDINRQTSTVFLDVGLEVHLQADYAGLPARGPHVHQLLANNIWGLTTAEWQDSLPTYQPDVWASNAHVAGFRCNFSRHPVTENQIYYAQVYASDKFQTYSAGSSSGLLLLASQVLKMKGPDDAPVQLQKIYQAISENQLARTPTVVRLEVRVPSHRAALVYDQELDAVDLSDYIYAIPLECVWAWRLHRITACFMLLRYSASLMTSSRKDIQNLILVATTVHSFNSIHSRPGTMIWDRQLAETIFSTAKLADDPTQRDLMLWSPRNNQESVPVLYNGALWLPSIVYPASNQAGVLRFECKGSSVEKSLLERLFRMDWASIEKKFSLNLLVNFFASGHLHHRKCAASSEPIKRKINLPATVTDLSVKRPRLLYHDNAPDIPREASIRVVPSNINRRNASEYFLGLLCQILERVGCTKAGQAYWKLTAMERRVVSLDTFRDMNLGTYFTSYQYTKTPSDWASLKTILFPGPHDTPPAISDPNVQGWRGVPYYCELLELRNVNPVEYDYVRRTCLALFDTLKWFIKVQSHKMIEYKLRSSWTLMFSGSLQTGVPISTNPTITTRITSKAKKFPVLDQDALHTLSNM
ncbi:hypothetical protein BDP27DRAFT_1512892 [Rhodocollybia butyracea]|uniref:Uncharacterized protein n=1 Tax=Rhodocollybia butyracea TaxID=206335 RepID=A0A9P5PVQ9_9AGAR|nr:hypothetical protein BDP27DRAFT_1512892 [Rhodocollybia butyracea]